MGHSQQTLSSPCLQQYAPKGASQLSHCPSTESNESKHIATIVPTRMNYENVNKYLYALWYQQYAMKVQNVYQNNELFVQSLP